MSDQFYALYIVSDCGANNWKRTSGWWWYYVHHCSLCVCVCCALCSDNRIGTALYDVPTAFSTRCTEWQSAQTDGTAAVSIVYGWCAAQYTHLNRNIWLDNCCVIELCAFAKYIIYILWNLGQWQNAHPKGTRPEQRFHTKMINANTRIAALPRNHLFSATPNTKSYMRQCSRLH